MENELKDQITQLGLKFYAQNNNHQEGSVVSCSNNEIIIIAKDLARFINPNCFDECLTIIKERREELNFILGLHLIIPCLNYRHFKGNLVAINELIENTAQLYAERACTKEDEKLAEIITQSLIWIAFCIRKESVFKDFSKMAETTIKLRNSNKICYMKFYLSYRIIQQLLALKALKDGSGFQVDTDSGDFNTQ